MLLNKDSTDRYRVVLEVQRINRGSFEFKVVTLDKTKVTMIDLFSILDYLQISNVFFSNILNKRKKWGLWKMSFMVV